MARKGENIHQRKDSRWEGRYIKGRNAQGKAVWGYVYGHSYTEVKAALVHRKAECAYFNLNLDDPTFQELAELWLLSVRNAVKESTIVHYRYTLDHYILPVLGERRVKTLSEALLEQGLRQSMEPTDGSHKPLGHSVAKECLTMVRRICKYARHLHMIRSMEIEVALPKPSENKETPLDPEEQDRVKAFILENPTPRKIGLLFAMQMGLRIGEVCGLQWGDLDLSEGLLTVRRTVQRIGCGDGHTKVVVQTPKTRTSSRQIPIPKPLVPVLRALRGSFGDDVWFLSGTNEKPVEPRCYRKSLRGYLKKAMVRPVHPHTLRHTFASTCLQKGCDIKTLSELMGHADASITLRRYVHTNLSRMRREIDRIYGMVRKKAV